MRYPCTNAVAPFIQCAIERTFLSSSRMKSTRSIPLRSAITTLSGYNSCRQSSSSCITQGMRPKLAVSRFTNLHGSIQNTSIRIRIPVVQFSSASAAEAVVTPRIAPLSLPPNLVIDPRSSFASQYLNKENDDNDDDAVSKDYKQDERREKRLSALRRKPATTGKTRSTIVRFTGIGLKSAMVSCIPNRYRID
jgi:hypothetical protein